MLLTQKKKEYLGVLFGWLAVYCCRSLWYTYVVAVGIIVTLPKLYGTKPTKIHKYRAM